MKRVNFIILLLLGLTCSLSLTNPAFGQNIDIIITPDEAQLDPGGTVKFELFGFSTENRRPVVIDSLLWSVTPDSMGTITRDGFFIAGKYVGEAKIEVTAFIANLQIKKEIIVTIGNLPKAFFDVRVVPQKAVVPVGTEKQFEVIITSPTGIHVRPEHVRWEVQPENLGRIDENGLFVAGEEINQGKVIALVEIDRLTLRAAAKVCVSPPPTGAISGTIMSDDNIPIAGARVKAIRLGRIHWVQSTESEADGRYFIGELIPGIYVVYVNANDYIGEFYDNTRNFLEATPLSIAENDTLNGIDFNLSQGGKIRGTVITEEGGEPLFHAHVMAVLVVNPRIAHHALTHEDGTYEISSLPTGTYAVRANAPGYHAEYFEDAENLESADFLNLQEPEIIENINFDLATASAIRGRVVNEEDGTPIAGARIRIFSPIITLADLRHLVIKETRTNENGEYIAQVRPGNYIVHASAEGFNGEFYDNVRDLASATRVPVLLNQHTTGIDFALLPLGSISGTVTVEGSSGEPIEGAVVQAYPQNVLIAAIATPNIVGFRAKTDADGNYTIENVPAGRYIVRAVAEGFLPEFYQEAESPRDAEPVFVEPNQHVEGIDFTLLLGGSISGFVGSEVDSLPIAGALVEVVEAHSKFHRRSYTEHDGTYKVGGLRSGQYYVYVVAKGYFPEFYDNVRIREEATLVEVQAPDETPDIDVYLLPFIERKGTIAGRVVSEVEESPIFGAVVIAVSRHNLLPHITFTGPLGYYHLTNLDPGKYFVFAWARGFIGEFYDDAKIFQEADPVWVRAGQVTGGINFALTPRTRQGIYAIRGRVTSAETGEPLKDVLVHALFGNNREVTAITDAYGSYVITEVPAGSYKIEASGVGYSTAYYGGETPESAIAVNVGDGNDAENVNLNLKVDNVTSVNSQDDLSAVPNRFDLLQNYPNPFNPETTIKYQLSEPLEVTVKIFNLLGQEIRTLVDKKQEAGVYTIQWDGKDNFGRKVASGIYIFQMKAGDKFKMSRRMVLLK